MGLQVAARSPQRLAANRQGGNRGGKVKIEKGVMVMKDGKAWGEVYADGRSTEYGWMAPENAPIHDPRFCKQPTDVTYEGSHYEAELRTGKLVVVERRTEVIINQ